MSKKTPRIVQAHRSKTFMESPDARALRILAEYLEPKKRFEDLEVKDTIVFFGSARTLSREAAEAALAAAKKREDGVKRKDGVKKAESQLAMSRYYEDTRELAKRLTLWSKGLADSGRRFVVCSGGGPDTRQLT